MAGGMNECPGADCELPTEVALLAQQMGVMREEMSAFRKTMDNVSEALTKIALVEERAAQTGKSLDRAFTAIAKVSEDLTQAIKGIDNRVKSLELAAVAAKQTNQWVDRAMVGAFGAMAAYVVPKIFGG